MKILFLLALFAAVAGGKCANAEPVVAASERHNVQIDTVWLSQTSVKEQCAARGSWGGVVPKRTNGPVGCNKYDRVTNICTIYATEPREVDDAYTLVLGHETLHCLSGKYHTQESL